MPAQANVKICTAATAYDDAYGNTVILVINEGLWLGGQMEHSLINPYQIRVNEGQLSDDPTNQDRLFGITIEGVEIPFKMKGSTCMFRTRTPD